MDTSVIISRSEVLLLVRPPRFYHRGWTQNVTVQFNGSLQHQTVKTNRLTWVDLVTCSLTVCVCHDVSCFELCNLSSPWWNNGRADCKPDNSSLQLKLWCNKWITSHRIRYEAISYGRGVSCNYLDTSTEVRWATTQNLPDYTHLQIK